jgi:CheY-like chemotaxis protein/tetratricopeptide (TPR) repeat protein
MPPSDKVHRATILLVDDDAASRQAIELLIVSQPRLRALRARVVKALDGNRALAAVQAERPDLVITELSIPGMDGWAFCRALRKLPSGAAVPILIVSGVPMNAALVADLASELQATFLPKPVQQDLLADAIVSAVSGTGARGSLAERGVARLLFEHLEASSTGTLVLVRGQMRKEIFLREGQVVAAESNLRQEALGALLHSKGVLDERQLQHLLTETKRRGQKMGTVLVELGWLGPDEVLEYLAAQSRKRVTDCLRWPDGSWSFVPGDAFAERVIEHKLDTARMLWKGLFRTAAPEELMVRLETDAGRPVKLSPKLEQWGASFEAVFGAQILPLLGEGGTLGSLVLRDDGQGVALAVEALLASGLAELGPPEEQPSAEAPATPRESIEAFPLDRLGSDAGGRMRTLQEASAEDEWAVTTDPNLQVVDELPQPAPTVASASLRPVAATQGPKGTHFGLGPSPRTEAGRSDPRNLFLREYLEVHGKSFYEILGVAAQATQQEIAAGYTRKMARFSDEAMAHLRLDPDSLVKLEGLRATYVKAYEALSDPASREGYDTEQVTPLVGDEVDPLGAELAFNEGETLLQAGRAGEASQLFQQAVAARPDQAAYHAYLGWSLFMAAGAEQSGHARELLDRALVLDPDLGKAHEFYGRLCVSAGDDAEARPHLERALELDPAQGEVVDLLISVHERLEDPRTAERSYRHLIALLGERELPQRARLWRLLGELYEARLGERDNARTAYENAARLAPGDVVAQRKVIELNAEEPGRWRESARALAAEWQLRPAEAALGARLLRLYQGAGRTDGASFAAAAMVLRGVADGPTQALAEQGRPRTLRRIARALDRTLTRRIAFPGEDEDLETVVGALAEAGIIPGEPPATDRPRTLAAGQQTATFRRVLRYLCQALGAEEPPALLVDDLPVGMRIADLRPTALLISDGLKDSTDTVEIGFRLARALASSKPGRAAAGGRTGRQMRPYFVALLALARGAPTLPDPDTNRVLQSLSAAPAGFKMVALEVGTRLQRGRKAIDLSGWVRAVGRTADRTALLLSGDLVRVGNAVAAEEGTPALEDLLAFAVSPEHLDLRDELGLKAEG